MHTVAEIKKGLNPSAVDLGVVQDGDIIPYSVQNNSPLDILCHTYGCSCVGKIKTSPRMLEGELPAEYKDTNQQLYIVDGEYCQKIQQPTGLRFYNVEKNGWVDNPTVVQDPVPATLFTQTVVIHMDDGESQFTINSEGKQEKNPKHVEINIPVKCWVIRK